MDDTQKQFYIENGGLKCPYCKSMRLGLGTPVLYELHPNKQLSYVVKITCNSCKNTWEDIYTFSDVRG